MPQRWQNNLSFILIFEGGSFTPFMLFIAQLSFLFNFLIIFNLKYSGEIHEGEIFTNKK